MSSQSVARSPLLAGTFGEMIGEFFGTMVLILFGDGCVATFRALHQSGTRQSICEGVDCDYSWVGPGRYAGYLCRWRYQRRPP